MKYIYSSIIILLLLLPLALQGQDFSFLPRRQANDWQTIVTRGGLFRWEEDEDYFIRIDGGLNSLMMMDFVNGYSLGPQATFGKILSDFSRIEIDENMRWAFSRRTLMAKGAVRYVFAPQFFGFFEIFGGRYTNDFDRYPVMNEAQRSLASGLFGWNHFKLYEQTTVGARLYGALSADLQLTGLVAWEKRAEVENFRRNNIFGTKPSDNVPIVQGERMARFGTDKLLRLDAQLDWMPGRKILVVDDFDAIAHSDFPNFSLRTTSGWNSGLRFLSVETSAIGAKKLGGTIEKISYMASAGFFAVRKNVLLVDARHFDASEFAFQQGASFTRFCLLDNYELSTMKYWLEAHAEAILPELLPASMSEGGMKVYVQAHAADVPGQPWHSEAGGGIDVVGIWRFGATIGFDDLKFRGVAFNILLNL